MNAKRKNYRTDCELALEKLPPTNDRYALWVKEYIKKYECEPDCLIVDIDTE